MRWSCIGQIGAQPMHPRLGSLPGLMAKSPTSNDKSTVYSTSLLQHVRQTSLHGVHLLNCLKRLFFGESFEELEGSVGAEDDERVSFFSSSAPSHLTVLVAVAKARKACESP